MRVAHVIAGAPVGGAEAFFERLAAAQHAAGEAVLAVIREDTGRAARLRAAGLDPVQLAFGGPFDLRTGPALRRALAAADVRAGDVSVVEAHGIGALSLSPCSDYMR